MKIEILDLNHVLNKNISQCRIVYSVSDVSSDADVVFSIGPNVIGPELTCMVNHRRAGRYDSLIYNQLLKEVNDLVESNN